MSTRTIQQLEHELHRDRPDPAQQRGPDLVAIRAAGMQRRHVSALYIGAGVLASVLVLGLALDGTVGLGDRASDPPPAGHPTELIPLAKRALAEVPGATQVSNWQVVLPEPAGAKRWSHHDDLVVVGTPVDTGAHYYTGVTAYRPTDFRQSLFRGVEQIEQTELAHADGSSPVGSTDMGILVDGGPAYLGCTAHVPSAKCGPTLLTRSTQGWVLEWGMGTDEFLKPGADMEVFLSDDYSTGAPGTLVLAGLPGLEVAKVDLVLANGQKVPAEVDSGTVVEGASMIWGRVTGHLAAVIAYDADGKVIENHKIRPCSDPIDCEVR